MTTRLGPLVRSRRTIAVAMAAAITCAAWIRCGPLPAGLLDPDAVPSTVLEDRRGRLLYEARSTLGVRGAPPSRVSPHVIAATLAAEDHRFFSHPGIDLRATLRAAWHNLRAGRTREGGSTITQQVAKLLLERRAQLEGRRAPRRGLRAKITEAVVALRLEHRMSKDDILSLYLTLAPYGNQIVGIDRASEAYFGVPASMLTLAQSAYLAGLPRRPSGYNPFRSPDEAERRQRAILDRIEARGLAPVSAVAEARRERVRLDRRAPAFAAPHFVAAVLASLGPDRPPRVRTTLDLDLQRDIEGIIEHQRASLERHGAHNVAVAVLDNRTGGWLAWEGSGGYFGTEHGGQLDGVTTPRQPGSALKPFVYALAFEQGRTPATVLPDIPSHFPTSEPGVLYSPRNYDGRYRGPMRARLALAGSENVPAVALASELGVPALLRFLRRAGFTTFDRTAAHYGLGVTLGNAEVRLDELVAAYAAFARGGEWRAPTFRLDPVERDSSRTVQRLASPRTAFWLTDILSDNEARAYAFGRGGSLEFPFAVAAKTGTSQAFHDNWAIGYTREVTVGVWVGNFDRTPLRDSSGVTGAGPIFHAAMLAALARARGELPSPDAPLTEAPLDLDRITICALSGEPAHDGCPSRSREWLPRGTARRPCAWHHVSDAGVLVVWPPEYRAWARAQGLEADPSARSQEARTGRRDSRVAVRTASAGPPAIANPPEGAIYLIDPTLRAGFQTLPLRAVSRRGGALEWRVNGQRVGETRADEALHWPLVRGRHRIEVRDRDGSTSATTILVK